MHVQQATSQQQSDIATCDSLPCFDCSLHDHSSLATAVYSDEVPRLAATLAARRDADKFGLAMTVYRTAETYGWSYTHSLADVLRKAEVFATILPSRFFQ
jgi:hypothetical protein